MEILKIRTKRVVVDLEEALSELVPDAPVDPVPDALMYQGLIEMLSPTIERLEMGIRDYQAVETQWDLDIRQATLEEKPALSAQYATLYKDLNCEAVVRAAKTKHSELQKTRTDWTIRARLASAAARDVVAPAAPAPPADSRRIPTSRVRPFNGERENWVEFWDSYNYQVHQSSNPSAQKLAYLKDLMQGEARKLLIGIPTTDANYDVAIQILQDRYADPDAIIQDITNRLNRLTAGKDFEGVRKFQSDIDMLCKQAEQEGEPITGRHYVQRFEAELPTDVLREIWQTKKKLATAGSPWTVKAFRKALYEYVKDEEKLRRAKEINYHPQISAQTQSHQLHADQSLQPDQYQFTQIRELEDFQPTVHENLDQPAIVLSAIEPILAIESDTDHLVSRRPRIWGCSFCRSQEHNSARCETYPTPQMKIRRIAELDLCSCCLNSGHVSRDCHRKEDLKCYWCHDSHYRFLCPNKRQSTLSHPPESSLAIFTHPGGGMLDTPNHRSMATEVPASCDEYNKPMEKIDSLIHSCTSADYRIARCPQYNFSSPGQHPCIAARAPYAQEVPFSQSSITVDALGLPSMPCPTIVAARDQPGSNGKQQNNQIPMPVQPTYLEEPKGQHFPRQQLIDICHTSQTLPIPQHDVDHQSKLFDIESLPKQSPPKEPLVSPPPGFVTGSLATIAHIPNQREVYNHGTATTQPFPACPMSNTLSNRILAPKKMDSSPDPLPQFRVTDTPVPLNKWPVTQTSGFDNNSIFSRTQTTPLLTMPPGFDSDPAISRPITRPELTASPPPLLSPLLTAKIAQSPPIMPLPFHLMAVIPPQCQPREIPTGNAFQMPANVPSGFNSGSTFTLSWTILRETPYVSNFTSSMDTITVASPTLISPFQSIKPFLSDHLPMDPPPGFDHVAMPNQILASNRQTPTTINLPSPIAILPHHTPLVAKTPLQNEAIASKPSPLQQLPKPPLPQTPTGNSLQIPIKLSSHLESIQSMPNSPAAFASNLTSSMSTKIAASPNPTIPSPMSIQPQDDHQPTDPPSGFNRFAMSNQSASNRQAQILTNLPCPIEAIASQWQIPRTCLSQLPTTQMSNLNLFTTSNLDTRPVQTVLSLSMRQLPTNMSNEAAVAPAPFKFPLAVSPPQQSIIAIARYKSGAVVQNRFQTSYWPLHLPPQQAINHLASDDLLMMKFQSHGGFKAQPLPQSPGPPLLIASPSMLQTAPDNPFTHESTVKKMTTTTMDDRELYLPASRPGLSLFGGGSVAFREYIFGRAGRLSHPHSLGHPLPLLSPGQSSGPDRKVANSFFQRHFSIAAHLLAQFQYDPKPFLAMINRRSCRCFRTSVDLLRNTMAHPLPLLLRYRSKLLALWAIQKMPKLILHSSLLWAS